MASHQKIIELLQQAKQKLAQKDDSTAERLFEKVLKKDKLNAQALHSLALIARVQRRYAKAESLLEKLIKVIPENATPVVDLGITYLEQKQLDNAERQFRKAIRLAPNHFHAYSNLGITYTKQDKIEPAIASYESALKINPQFYVACFNLGKLYKQLKRYGEAEKYYRQALAINPKYREARQALLFMLSFYQVGSTDELYETSLALNQSALPTPDDSPFTHTNAKQSGKLRIGYMSPDFRYHAVSFFITMILENHDRAKVEVFCYSQTRNEDETTEYIKGLADHWITTYTMNDATLAERIYQDKIDVLIDLAGHTRGSRIDVCARKPAPVQATYLGYSSTTGAPGVDYWITDDVVHPETTKEKTSETIYRLPRCWVAYKPDFPAEKIAQKRQEGPVIFASFNNLDKISDDTLDMWCEILSRLPQAKMMIKAKQLRSQPLKALFVERCQHRGFDLSQLIFADFTQSYEEHMALYNTVDIALDSFPTTGGTTTADALWMGVPVITLAGNRFMRRMGASLLSSANLPEYIAESPQQYVEKAVNLAKTIVESPTLRQHIHATVKDSPLFDGKDLTLALEDAYAAMWDKYQEAKTT